MQASIKRPSWQRLALLCMALGTVSCRGVLGIHPGKPGAAADSGTANAGSHAAGSSGAAGGDASTARTDGGGAGQAGAAGQAGHGGTGGHGGASGAGGQAGSAGTGSLDDAGAADAGPAQAFPAGECRKCIARNCTPELDACAITGNCLSSVSDWLSCTQADASMCVTATAGALQTLENCAREGCDLCRHTTDNQPSVEILSPSNRATVVVDSSGLIEVSLRVHHFNVMGPGSCGTDTNCGHVHINLDTGTNCRVTPFYNALVSSVAADGSQDTAANTTACLTQSVIGRTVPLTVSLSDYASHADRVPTVQSTVNITLTH